MALVIAFNQYVQHLPPPVVQPVQDGPVAAPDPIFPGQFLGDWNLLLTVNSKIDLRGVYCFKASPEGGLF